ncbi:CPK2 [Symbiodinium sp. CCMP2592]|nr:CPK2 [Symbiodinium sp. CCMP2592]
MSPPGSKSTPKSTRARLNLPSSETKFDINYEKEEGETDPTGSLPVETLTAKDDDEEAQEMMVQKIKSDPRFKLPPLKSILKKPPVEEEEGTKTKLGLRAAAMAATTFARRRANVGLIDFPGLIEPLKAAAAKKAAGDATAVGCVSCLYNKCSKHPHIAKPDSGGRAQFIDNPGNILHLYELEKKKLGEGSLGYVCKAKNTATGLVRAVKTIAKGDVKNMERLNQEIAIMKMMDHPNIIKLYESFEDERNIYLVMELCSGGEVFAHIIENGNFTEVIAATLMQQIIRAVHYMHENKVAHRDLKPETFLFASRERLENNCLKIIDVGLSCKFVEGQMLAIKAGAPYYVAPEVLSGNHDEACDLWSCGVIMYVLLCGYPPFFGDSDQEVLSKVKMGNFGFNPADWKNVSEDAKDLIRSLLQMKPRARFTADQALQHEWIKLKAPRARNDQLESAKEQFFSSLKYRSDKAHLPIIRPQNEDQIKQLRDVLMMIDSNGTGLVTLNEMKEGLSKAGLKDIPVDWSPMQGVDSSPQHRRRFASWHTHSPFVLGVDSDGSLKIDYTELLAATLDRMYSQEDVCWSAFRVFDRGGDGKISI